MCLDLQPTHARYHPAGMLYLHTRSPAIYHRDLKSANLLVTSQYQVKVRVLAGSRHLPAHAIASATAAPRMRLLCAQKLWERLPSEGIWLIRVFLLFRLPTST